MSRPAMSRGARLLALTAGITMLATLAGCSASTKPGTQAAPKAASSPAAAASAAAPSGTPAQLAPLSISPDVALIGDAVNVSAQGLPANKPVKFMIATQEGSYQTKIDLGSIEFLQPAYTAKRIALGDATTDAQGKVQGQFKLPDDFGSAAKDVYAVVDGKDVAKGGVFVQRIASISVSEGPVGTPITIQLKGLGADGFQSTVGVRWDNKYVGYMSSTTTQGTATAVIRAAGPVGQHFIDLGPASAAVPYLNPQQTPRKITIPTYRFTFNVTADNGAPPATVEWPDPSKLNMKPTALALSPNWGATNANSKITATVDPVSGPILSTPSLKIAGLAPNSSVDVVWRTITGSDVTGWAGNDMPISKITAAADGTATTKVNVPDGVGGWHTIGVVQDGKVVAEAAYFVERSLVGVTPSTVKAGEKFTVHIKGVGWTELDNSVAVLYDNNYVGYACGFGSGGDITVELMATGGPGTHLIELYPDIYNRGFDKRHYWDYEVPTLTFAQDHPGLSLGYKLPVFRLAVTVVP